MGDGVTIVLSDAGYVQRRVATSQTPHTHTLTHPFETLKTKENFDSGAAAWCEGFVIACRIEDPLNENNNKNWRVVKLQSAVYHQTTTHSYTMSLNRVEITRLESQLDHMRICFCIYSSVFNDFNL